MITVSVFLQVLVLPGSSGIADRARRKTRCSPCAYVGAMATMLLYFVRGSSYLLGGLLLVLANVAFGAHGRLQRLPPRDRRRGRAGHRVLPRLGDGLPGGAVLLLLLNLVLYTLRDSLGLSEGQAVRVTLLSAGLWWASSP